MLKRIKQIIAAVTAKISFADHEFIAEKLSLSERELFYAMNLPDQRHVLNVTYTAMQLAGNRSDVDMRLLLKCALLHDVGKVRGDVSTADKVIAVLADKFFSQAAKSWEKEGRGGKIDNLRHALYIYYNHAIRGAAMLLKAGAAPEVAGIVKQHHLSAQACDPPELQILRRADDLH